MFAQDHPWFWHRSQSGQRGAVERLLLAARRDGDWAKVGLAGMGKKGKLQMLLEVARAGFSGDPGGVGRHKDSDRG